MPTMSCVHARASLCSFSLALLLGCARHEQTPPAAPQAGTPSEPTSEPAPAPRAEATRELPRDATYRELVSMLDAEKALGAPEAPCLLARTEQGFRFAGEASAALHPLPPHNDDLDDVMREGPSLRVLTRHGSFGARDASLGFVALTRGAATRTASLLLITDRAFYVRSLNSADTLTTNDATQAVNEAQKRSVGGTLYVAAEGRVSVASVYDALEGLAGHTGPVVLAAVLPRDVVLPAPPSTQSHAARCPDGLPETDALSGDMPVAEIQAGMSPLRERVPDCLAQADGPAAAGDKLTLALRIDAGGQVSDACVVSSEADDDTLSSCVLALARGLSFSPPSPTGVVDVQLPLAIRPEAAAHQASVCR